MQIDWKSPTEHLIKPITRQKSPFIPQNLPWLTCFYIGVVCDEHRLASWNKEREPLYKKVYDKQFEISNRWRSGGFLSRPRPAQYGNETRPHTKQMIQSSERELKRLKVVHKGSS